MLESFVERIKRGGLRDVLVVQQAIIKAVHEFMAMKEVVQMMPLVLSPITDPLNHSVVDATIQYADQTWSLTKSLIFHKQIALLNPELESVYVVSPNVRLEMKDRQCTGRHAIEFTQVDFEFRAANKAKVMSFVEDLVTYVFQQLNCTVADALLRCRGALLSVPDQPFKCFRTEDLIKKFGANFEHRQSLLLKEPFWILNHKREFYDKEDPLKPGSYLNYDLVWPEGFGEALSGGEREHEYEQILRRMRALNTSEQPFENYLELAKQKLLVPSAGGGIGIERMTRFVCRLASVDDVAVFSRQPFVPAPF